MSNDPADYIAMETHERLIAELEAECERLGTAFREASRRAAEATSQLEVEMALAVAAELERDEARASLARCAADIGGGCGQAGVPLAVAALVEDRATLRDALRRVEDRDTLQAALRRVVEDARGVLEYEDARGQLIVTPTLIHEAAKLLAVQGTAIDDAAKLLSPEE